MATCRGESKDIKTDAQREAEKRESDDERRVRLNREHEERKQQRESAAAELKSLDLADVSREDVRMEMEGAFVYSSTTWCTASEEIAVLKALGQSCYTGAGNGL